MSLINFNPLTVVTFTRDCLRKLFMEFCEEYAWDEDPNKSKIWIGTVNDYNAAMPIQKIPRILLQRGDVITNTLSISNGLDHVHGTPNDIIKNFRKDLQGMLNLVVETTSEGSCELLAENVRRFIVWSKPFIEEEFGFQRFAHQVSVSQCMPDRENKEKFKIQIAIPYIVEDRWFTQQVYIRLKAIFQEVKSC